MKKFIAKGIFVGLIFYVTILVLQLFTSTTYDVNNDYDYLIIPGSLVKPDGTPDIMLKQRLNTALDIISQQQSKMKIVVSGGQGDDEPISEAKAMKHYLLENGIVADRIILEEQATSTFENIKFSKKLVQGEVLIISQQFHLQRIKMFIRRNNLNWDVHVVNNDLILPLKPAYREPFALIKSLLFDH